MTMKLHPIPARLLHIAAALSLAAGLGACASKGVAPVAELATARASISQAESAGALDAAPVELLTARDKLGKAEAAAREERFTDARRLAAQAEADAEVAERKARAVKAQAAATALANSNELLRKEIERKSVR
jgi:hypothetical protein